MWLTIAKNRPVDNPHMRMPVNPSIGASNRQGVASTTSP
jgi:hypothetical protein